MAAVGHAFRCPLIIDSLRTWAIVTGYDETCYGRTGKHVRIRATRAGGFEFEGEYMYKGWFLGAIFVFTR